MAIQIKTKVGNSVISISGKDEKDLIEQVSFFEELPCECGKCQSKNLGFRYRRAKDYDFYELRCKDCRATFALGQKKEGGGLYPRGSQERDHEGEWEAEYKGDRGERHDRRDDRDRDRGDSRNDRRGDRQDSRRDDRRTTAADDDDIAF